MVVFEVRPKPICDQRMAGPAERDARQVAHGVDRDLRIVGTRLDAQVAVAPLGLERVAHEWWQALQLGAAAG